MLLLTMIFGWSAYDARREVQLAQSNGESWMQMSREARKENRAEDITFSEKQAEDAFGFRDEAQSKFDDSLNWLWQGGMLILTATLLAMWIARAASRES